MFELVDNAPSSSAVIKVVGVGGGGGNAVNHMVESNIEGSERHISMVVARKGELLENLSKVEGESNENAEEERNIKSTTTTMKRDYLKKYVLSFMSF